MIGATRQQAQQARPGFGAGGSGGAAALPAELEDLKLLILAMWREVGGLGRKTPTEPAPAGLDFQSEVRRFESDLIRCALIRTGGRQRGAARLLGIKAATLNAKIKRYASTRTQFLTRRPRCGSGTGKEGS